MTDWNQKFGGQRWRLDCDDRLVVEDEGIPRTPGAPLSAQTVEADYGPAIDEAVSVAIDCVDSTAPRGRLRDLVGLMVLLESSRLGESFHRDPTALREEPDYVSDTETPGEVSPGLMQTLLSTAERMVDRYGLWDGEVDRQTLYVPLRSLVAGTAYIAQLGGKYGWDPVLLSAAYNAGGVYKSSKNDWHLRSYGDRLDQTVRWWNDWQEVHG